MLHDSVIGGVHIVMGISGFHGGGILTPVVWVKF